MILLHFSIFTPVQLDSSLWPPPEQATWSQAPPPRSTVNSGMLGVEVGGKGGVIAGETTCHVSCAPGPLTLSYGTLFCVFLLILKQSRIL